MTPTGEGKKPKNSGRPSGSYAEAAATFLANSLCVAVMTEPFQDLSQPQAEAIRDSIEDKLRDELLADLDATLTTTPNDLRFRGRPHHSDGVLKTWCEDDFTLRWLVETVDALESPLPNTKLVVRPQSAIPRKVSCVVSVPGRVAKPENLQRLLARQNRHLNINAWDHTATREHPDGSKTSLHFRIPEAEARLALKNDRRLYYLMGNIYVIFLETVPTAPTDANKSANPTPAQPAAPESPVPSEPTASTSVAQSTRMDTDTATAEVAAQEGDNISLDNPSSPLLRSDEECFPGGGGGSDLEDLPSSPLRD